MPDDGMPNTRWRTPMASFVGSCWVSEQEHPGMETPGGGELRSLAFLSLAAGTSGGGIKHLQWSLAHEYLALRSSEVPLLCDLSISNSIISDRESEVVVVQMIQPETASHARF